MTPSPEAQKQGVCHTKEECRQMYLALNHEIKVPALKMLAEELGHDLADIQSAYNASPEGWYVGHHFFWGMGVRNLLRSKGFGESYFGIHNLDDIYIDLVEEALNLGGVR